MPLPPVSCACLTGPCAGVLTDEAHVLERNGEDVYVHYANTDKRLDEWVRARDVRPAVSHEADVVGNGTRRKRKRGLSESDGARRTGSPGKTPAHTDTGAAGHASPVKQESVAPVTEEELDMQLHRQITAKRNFDKVVFGRWQIKTWYALPACAHRSRRPLRRCDTEPAAQVLLAIPPSTLR